MKQIYTKIIILLVFLIGGLGCVKNSAKDSESGLTSINVGVDGVQKIINSVSSKYPGIKMTGIAVLITNNATPPLRCYNPPQTNDTNTDDCVLSQKDIDFYNKNIKDLKKTSDHNLLQYYSRFYNPKEETTLYDTITLPVASIQNGTLSGIKIKYNDSYNYYGHMIVNCTHNNSKTIQNEQGIKEKVATMCLHSHKNVPAQFDKNNNKLNIEIPLKWGKDYGGSNAITVTATGEPEGNNQQAEEVSVDITTELDNQPADKEDTQE